MLYISTYPSIDTVALGQARIFSTGKDGHSI